MGAFLGGNKKMKFQVQRTLLRVVVDALNTEVQ
jgi:hypothetical protein